MAFLPEKFSRAQEGLRMLELPTHHRIPLVELEGKISMAADPFGIIWVHDGFGCGTDGYFLVKLSRAPALN
jgi:hypothetical protein